MGSGDITMGSRVEIEFVITELRLPKCPKVGPIWPQRGGID